jgi:hypothetical protein
VLDPLPEAERLPLVAGLFECVEGVTVGEVADRVDGNREACARGMANQLGEVVPAGDLDARAVEQARSLGAERPVHEDLQVAEPDPRPS